MSLLSRFIISSVVLSAALAPITSRAGDPPPVIQVFRAGAGTHEGQGIAIGQNGNIYATGQYQGTAEFGATTLTNGGSFDYYLSAYNAAGQPLWAKGAGSTGADFGSDVIVDTAGNLLVVGVIQGPADFHGATNVTGFGNKDWFLAKYTSAGSLLWVTLAGGADSDQAFDVAEDGAGNYLVAGRIRGVATFGTTTIGASSQDRCILAKFDNAGAVVWVRDVAPTDSTSTAGLAADAAGNSYVTGLSQTSGAGPFLAKYDAAGTQQWMFVAGTGFTYFEEGSGVDFDAAGNIYVAGRFSATTLTIGTSVLSNPNGFPTGFIAKFDSAGNPLWAIKAGARAFDVDTTPDGTSFVTGFYNTNARSIGTETPNADPGSLEVYITKVSSLGEVLWVKASAAFGGGPGRAIVHTAAGSTFAIGESSSELFDVGTFPGGVFIAELREAATGPSLSIAIVGGKLLISWPASFTGYTLESSTTVDGLFAAGNVQLAPVPGQPNTYTTDLPPDDIFFRLRK